MNYKKINILCVWISRGSLLLLLLCASSIVSAVVEQTYNHDESFMQQFLVSETGAGHLTPNVFYRTLHSSYQKKAYLFSKAPARLKYMVDLKKEIEYAESIDSIFKRRAKIAALDMAERTPLADFVWYQGAGKNITSALGIMKTNIKRLSSFGTEKEFTEWQNQYNLLQGSVNCIRQAYLPNSERQREYTRIYSKAQQLNEELSSRIDFLYAYRKMQDAEANARPIENIDHAAIAARVLLKWQDRWKSN
ncbi:DUF5045 domain-containing protein [Prevotella jejuni]|uniref:DUF5045 domain-containing protein n=1 Tax=Prevotella jejuni TaxID=1177574 RepID=UPI003211BE88